MIFFIFLIPVITCIILMWKFRKETTIWEYMLIIIPSLLIYFLCKYIFISTNTWDTEYLGDYITSVIYYEEWDEMVLVTKTKEVPCGTDKDGNTKYTTETYTEWEHRIHPEEWYYTSANTSGKHYISKNIFNLIKSKLNTTSKFIDMHRNYHLEDGDAYKWDYDNKYEHCYTITNTHMYENKVMASDHSIFKFQKLSDNDIKENKLYEYPDINNLDQDPILGMHISKKDMDAVKYLNAYYGKKFQIRFYILLFNNSDINVADLQRSYWEGGNKNEFVICLGVKNRKVQWCCPFSWSDEPTLEVLTRQYFNEHPVLNLSEYCNFIIPNLHKWHRKQFKDFEYLQIQLNNWQILLIFILILLYNIGISYYVVTNEYKADINKKRNYRYGNKRLYSI